MPTVLDPHQKLSLTYRMDPQSKMPTTLDPHPKLSPTYEMDQGLRMPTGTIPLSKTKSYQRDRPMIKDARGHLILIQN